MKNYWKDIRTIGEVLFFILVYLSLSRIQNPLYTFCLLAIYVIYWSYNFYTKLRYRQGKANYLLFPTKNDEYSRMTSITIGSLLLLASLAFLLWKQPASVYAIIGLVIGLLVLLNGLFDVPKGQLSIQHGLIRFSALDHPIDPRSVKEIRISREQIRLTTDQEHTQQINHLLLDSNSIARIRSYLSEKIPHAAWIIANNPD
jgi:hypothetical protein